MANPFHLTEAQIAINYRKDRLSIFQLGMSMILATLLRPILLLDTVKPFATIEYVELCAGNFARNSHSLAWRSTNYTWRTNWPLFLITRQAHGMTPPATTDAFILLLENSTLLKSEQYKSYLVGADPNPGAKEGLARRLTRAGLLTTFQSRQLLQGRFKGFFLTDKYKILDVIGEGGMGRVLLCEHLMLQRLVAVKILNFQGQPPPPGTTERFLREARAAAALDHPNITRVFDADKGPSGPFLVMEYVDGTNLHQVVSDNSPLSPERAANYIYQTSLALAQAHKRGLIHRDIKPGNLLLDRSGTVKLLDLGLARYLDDEKNDSLTKRFDARNVLGTADFIAPEQTQNSSKVDIRADIYSLGCSLYYLLTRRLPFEEGSITQKLLWHQTRNLPDPEDEGVKVPPELRAILNKMTKKLPEDRYQTPQELTEALSAWSVLNSLPRDEEMPKVRASSYQLGLYSPPVEKESPKTASTNTSTTPTPRTGSRSAPQRIPSPEVMQPTEEFHSRESTGDSSPVDSDSIEATSLEITIPVGLMQEDQFSSNAYSAPTELRPLPPAIERSLRRWIILAVALTAIVCFAGSVLAYFLLVKPASPVPTETVKIKMAGSSLISSLMNDWLDEYQAQAGSSVSYKPVGSGDGLSLLARRQILLGATDAPIPDTIRGMAKNDPIKGELVAIPLVMSGVSVAYNVPEIKASSPLRFDGPTLARIYLGEIKNWNHEDIKKLNPSLAERLPNLPIQVGIREDGSGTSFIWTSYLKSASEEWKLKGREPSTQPEWPSTLEQRLPGKRNDGLAENLEKTAGSIGYLDASSIEKHKLQAAQVKNKAGQFVSANNSTLQDAVYSGVQEGADLEKISLINQSAKNAYPIVGVTWGAFFTTHAEKRDSQELAKFLNWVLDSGDNAALKKNFVPLSLELKNRAKLVINKLDTK
jgi:eukaryotic-like serine/threonine-protein kinase